MKKIFLLAVVLFSVSAYAQYKSKLSADDWTDSVFNSLTKEERIAQLMVIRAHSNLGPDHVAKVTNDIQQYNVGALCFFQGGPIRQANLTNFYQRIAKTPLMITIDGEWGLGMRLDSVTKFPYQLTLGALSAGPYPGYDQRIVYEMGLAVGEQCKRMGIHVNYAPVVDINNNPDNPVIGFRSFGEDSKRVIQLGIAYMKGMQDAGILACAKHFPGHGDVNVDSHLDLPVINKSKTQLDSAELKPFRELIKAGVGSVMVAHLSVPAIDTAAHRASSISRNTVTGVLRNEIGFNGLTFTDALEMKGVANYFPGGVISVEALIAGNDMLCLPASVPEAIEQVKKAIEENRISWDEIEAKVKKVLKAKYLLGLNQLKPVDTTNLLNDLNARTDAIRYQVARQTITLLKSNGSKTKLPLKPGSRLAYVAIGDSAVNELARGMIHNYKADVYLFSWKEGDEKADSIFEKIEQNKYDAVMIGVHNFSNRPANNYGISRSALSLWRKINKPNSITLVFGNVLAAANFCEAAALVTCYQDDDITRNVAMEFLQGKTGATGKLPVRVCNFLPGFGIEIPQSVNGAQQLTRARHLQSIDSIVNDAIARKAFPGCVVMALKDGKIIYNKAFGNTTYEQGMPVTTEHIFDLASVTKISATTLAVMKLYEQGKLSLKKTLADYLPWVKGSNKANLLIEDILLHQAGLVPFIPFYRETIDTVTGIPKPELYSDKPKPGYTVRVAENLYMKNSWQDTMMKRILQSPLSSRGRYVYSDNDFIFLGKIVESITGTTLDQYVQKNFYNKMGLVTTGFNPRHRFPLNRIVPTEKENHFRRQLLQGDVHDEGASMFGGVSGHAGLFSDAYDLAMLYQMLLDGGVLNNQRFLKPQTIKLFTAYHSENSRRGYGFDKPEKDNQIRKDPYPSLLASPQTYGHTGFTGTCVWVDPSCRLVFVFLSNRVHPTRNNPLLSQLRVREKILDALIEAVQ
jgi:beta-glucosidase-like glycosyl hydrolase/CubicO group peptidase (beta-lactamase class C family)